MVVIALLITATLGPVVDDDDGLY